MLYNSITRDLVFFIKTSFDNFVRLLKLQLSKLSGIQTRFWQFHGDNGDNLNYVEIACKFMLFVLSGANELASSWFGLPLSIIWSIQISWVKKKLAVGMKSLGTKNFKNFQNSCHLLSPLKDFVIFSCQQNISKSLKIIN